MRTKQPEPSAETPADAASADVAYRALPDPLKDRLAALGAAPEQISELAVSLFPYGYRALLEAYDLITTTSPITSVGDSVDQDDPRQRVRLTPLGRAIIEACADDQTSSVSREDLERRAAELREQYGGELPFVAVESRS